jgi:hypothetical protein
MRKLDPGDDLSLMNDELRRRFLGYYAESNARVARRYLGRTDGVLFAAPSDRPSRAPLDPANTLPVMVSLTFNHFIAETARLKQELQDLRLEVEDLRTALGRCNSAWARLPSRAARALAQGRMLRLHDRSWFRRLLGRT